MSENKTRSSKLAAGALFLVGVALLSYAIPWLSKASSAHGCGDALKDSSGFFPLFFGIPMTVFAGLELLGVIRSSFTLLGACMLGVGLLCASLFFRYQIFGPLPWKAGAHDVYFELGIGLLFLLLDSASVFGRGGRAPSPGQHPSSPKRWRRPESAQRRT